MKLSGKDFKTAIVNILKDLKGNMNVMSREIEYIKYNKREFLELKNTLSNFFLKITKWAYQQIRNNKRNISELKDIATEIILNKILKKKKTGKK